MERKLKNIFVEGAIQPSKIADSISSHSVKKDIGAHSIFLGQVRADIIDGKAVDAIHYSTYQEMALLKMNEIREEIFLKYPIICMHVYHSLGEVKSGEVCLFVFTSSSHRCAAIQSCNEVVERIKKELPVWGKEIFLNGEHIWKINS